MNLVSCNDHIFLCGVKSKTLTTARFATPTKLDVIADQTTTEAKKSLNYKDLSLRALPRPRMNAKGAFTSFGQNAQLPHTVTKVCWFLMMNPAAAQAWAAGA